MPSWVTYLAKWLVSLAGVVGIAISQGLVTGTAAKWAAIIIGAIASVGVWRVPNAGAPTSSPAAASPAGPAAVSPPVPPAPAPPK